MVRLADGGPDDPVPASRVMVSVIAVFPFGLLVVVGIC
jgi:hypothetical protein